MEWILSNIAVIATVFSALVGSIIGAFCSALFGARFALKLRESDQRDRKEAITSAFQGEASIIGELLAVDLDLSNLSTKEGAMYQLHRLSLTRHIYDGIGGDIGALTAPRPQQLVRFYGRIQASVQQMEKLVSQPGFFARINNEYKAEDSRREYTDLLRTISIEADIVSADLLDDSKQIIS